MHIPDGYLGPQTYAVLDAAIVPVWMIASARIKKTLKAKQVPLLALGAAFAFVIMMFNVPVIGGSTGHAVGAVLIAILLGPWAACIAVSIALVVQAFVFGDGGITSIGANCINMAVVMPFVGFYLYRLIAGDRPGNRRRIVASGIAAYVGIVAAAIATGIEFGIQPLIAHTAAGQALYAPYPLAVAVPAMAIEHLVFFGPIEALITMGIVAVLARQDSPLLDMKRAARPLRWLWAGFALLVLLTPIGVIAPGTAWGEWGAGELKNMLGYAPAGLERLGGIWTSAMPDYAPPFIRDPLIGYLVAAIVGSAIVLGVTWLLGRALARKGDDPPAHIPVGDAVIPALSHVAGAGARTRGRSLARKTADAIGRAIAEVLENDEVASTPGLMQRLDPRVKLLSVVALAVAASFVHSIPMLLTLIAATAAAAEASRIGVASFSRKVWASAGFFGVLLAAPSATAWITPGAVLVPLGPLSITAPGLVVAARLVLRVAAGAGFGLLVIWTTRWTDLLRALSAMGVPDMVVSTLAMTQKQIMSLLRTVENVHLARESRMLSSGSAHENRGWVVERMAFVARKSMKTADDVYDAMLARGFDGSMRSLVDLRAERRDGIWMAACVATCALILLADRMVFPL